VVTTLNHRGCGYCTNPECSDYSKGVFLLDQSGSASDPYLCTGCRVQGFREYEHAAPLVGDPKIVEPGQFREVRLEYDFEPHGRIYKGLAIVIDNGIRRGRFFTFFSPLVRTEKRALYLAEKILGALQLGAKADFTVVGASTETVVSFDDEAPELRRKLGAWFSSRRWVA
jgi:hypothetical protein